MPQSRPRVLLVDDDDDFARMATLVLREGGFDVSAFDSGEAALRDPAAGFEAAVLDFQLPGATGLALLDSLRERSPDLQAVLLSGHGDMGTVIEGLQH
ncbi:MAG TPA: response regulator, partial [Vicinamibacteria bacterium]